MALGKPSRQSSVWAGAALAAAGGGNDGQRTGHFGFHTDEDAEPWWEVDLGEPTAIREVRIYNRLGAGQERARALRVLLSHDGVAWKQIHD